MLYLKQEIYRKFFNHISLLLNYCKVFADKFMRREVQAFVVHCTFEEDGCHWKGEVRHIEVNRHLHLQTYIVIVF